jgi:hypothetical protein
MAETMGREQTFFKILVFFAVVTVVTGILNGANSGLIDINALGNGNFDNNIALQTGIAPMGSSAYTEGSNSAQGSTSTGIDLTSVSSINENLITRIGGPWTLYSGSGLILTGLPFGAGTLNPSVVVLRNVQTTSGVYSVTYKVSNPTGADFYIFPRFIDGYSGSDLKVVFSSDGIHVKKFPLAYGFFDNGDDYYTAIPNIQNTQYTGSLITTTLTETVSTTITNTPDYTSLLTVQKDGVTVINNLPVRSILPGANINDQVRHGGVGADELGFTAMGFENTHQTDTNASFISGDSVTVSQVQNAWDIAGMFLFGVSAIFGMTSSAVVPFWLWSIIAIPCITTLGFIYLELARGN